MLTNDGDYALLKVILRTISEVIPNAEVTLPLWNYKDLSGLKKWRVIVFKASQPMMPRGILDMLLKLIWAILYRFFKITSLDKEVRAIAESDIAIAPTRDMLVLGSLGRITQFFHTLFLVYLPKLMGKPTMLYAVDIRPGGGLAKALLHPWLRLILNKLDMITVRDKDSFYNLVRLGVDMSKVRLVADPVFLLESATNEEALKILEEEGIPIEKRPIMGLSLNPLVYRPRRISKSSQQEIMLILTNLVDFMIEELGATVIFIPRVKIFKDDDIVYAKTIKRLIKHKNKFFVLSRQYEPEQIRAIIGFLDFFIALAFHALIHVVCMRVPLVAVDYGRKVLETMHGLGLGEFVIPARELTLEDFKDKVKLAWSMRDYIRNTLSNKITKYKVLARLNTEAFKVFVNNYCQTKVRPN